MGRYLYVMLSRTDTGMGRVIRRFTGAHFNHVSLSLDDELRHFVSFARYHRDVALAGGYVTEPAGRLLASGASLPVRIFRLDIRDEDAQQLEQLFRLAGDRTSGLIYNSLGAFLSTLHIPCPVPGAYTCLNFAGVILGQSFSSLQALEEALSPWELYQGDYSRLVSAENSHEDPFFERRGFFRGIGDTAAHFGRLLGRLLRLRRVEDPLKAYEGTILEYNKNAVSV